MQRRVLFLLAWFSLFPIVVKAQENPRQLNVAGSSSPGSSNSTAVSLLQQSHDAQTGGVGQGPQRFERR